MIVIVGTEIQNIVRINVNYFDERVKSSRQRAIRLSPEETVRSWTRFFVESDIRKRPSKCQRTQARGHHLKQHCLPNLQVLELFSDWLRTLLRTLWIGSKMFSSHFYTQNIHEKNLEKTSGTKPRFCRGFGLEVFSRSNDSGPGS